MHFVYCVFAFKMVMHSHFNLIWILSTILFFCPTSINCIIQDELRDVTNEISNETVDSNGNVNTKAGLSVNEDEMIFKYYNRDYTTGTRIFINNISSEHLPGWRRYMPLKVITHGWLSSEISPAVHKIKEAYILKTDYNVITVDWSESASWKAYPLPAYMTYQVGGIVARLLDELIKQELVGGKHIHVIGHSLGSHVAGATGAQVTMDKIYRITGLDPAGPLFELFNYITRNVLDISDAEFVDVIHTASGVAGYYNVLGHADFYPNGGTPIQPGCYSNSSGVDYSLSCSHGRAYEFFCDSIIHPHTFKAVKCDTWSKFKNFSCAGNEVVYMGEETPNTASGVYYLETRAEPPYGLDNQEDEQEIMPYEDIKIRNNI